MAAASGPHLAELAPRSRETINLTEAKRDHPHSRSDSAATPAPAERGTEQPAEAYEWVTCSGTLEEPPTPTVKGTETRSGRGEITRQQECELMGLRSGLIDGPERSLSAVASPY
ncbi:hypothetical protein NDU88_003508 [Pleurodeles waltl]|uniref:Uncharacterized protein n=1 Tax=Pleurodeles waltl TaxID=8319 RepID=A0AAV7M488_PLEWA|nr:hypothetical protein NDU88_003508 [Pleurodeles waltl]